MSISVSLYGSAVKRGGVLASNSTLVSLLVDYHYIWMIVSQIGKWFLARFLELDHHHRMDVVSHILGAVFVAFSFGNSFRIYSMSAYCQRSSTMDG